MELSAKKSNKLFFILTAILLILLSVGGRALSHLYSVVKADITYSIYIVYLMTFLSEVTMSLRICLSFAATSCAVYSLNASGVILTVLLALGASLFDFAGWYFIASVTNLLSQAPLATSILLTNQLLIILYEFVFILLSLLLSKLLHMKYRSLTVEKMKKKYSAFRAAAASILLMLTSQLGIGLYNLFDSIFHYQDFTAASIPSTVGSFLYMILVYGVIPLATAGIFVKIYAKKRGF